jgi:hypothetical protein
VTRPSRTRAVATPGAERFNAAYYDRFYRRRSTRVSDVRETAKLGRFVSGYVDYLGIQVKRVLDAGCGRWW